MKKLLIQIGKKIKEARISKKMTQQELARKIITDKSYIGHLETDFKTPSLKLLNKIAKVLNVPMGYFFDDAISINEVSYINPKIKRILNKIENMPEKSLDFINEFLSAMEKYQTFK